MIPLSVPNLKGNEKQYVLDALDSGWISSAGSYVARFEKDMASYINAAGGAAVQRSGTCRNPFSHALIRCKTGAGK